VRDDDQRLDDVLAAAEAIAAHLRRGTLDDGLVFDASVPWQDIAGMRDHLAHRYFDTDHALVAATVEHDLPLLVDAVRRLRAGRDTRVLDD
jgi:uncharacterized protein with HEPN domain